MLLKPKELIIDSKKPFDADILGREKQAETLTRVLGDLQIPFVVAVDSAFGTGKTTFVKMWQCRLQNAGFKTLFFNAWENDFTENAIVSLLGEFRETLKAAKPDNKFSKALLKVGSTLAKKAVPISLKLLSAGVIDQKEVADAVSEISGKIAEDRIKKYEEEKNTIEAFKRELEEFVKEFGGGRPVFFIIDELDRCRPLFAIEVLEHAKHLFNVNGIVFVLAVDKKQLGCSLRAVYGNGLDIDGYLGKFIDLTFALPPPSLIHYLQSLEGRFNDFDGLKSQSGGIVKRNDVQFMLLALATVFPISLRTIEQIVTHFVIAWKLSAVPNVSPSVFVALITIRRVAPAQYPAFIGGQHKFPGQDEKLRAIFKNGYLSSAERGAAAALFTFFRVFGLTENESADLKAKVRTEPNQNQQPNEESEYLWRWWSTFSLDDLRRQHVLSAVELAAKFGAE